MTHQALPRFTLLVCLASAVSAQSAVLLDAMSQELNRNFSVLKEKADPPPYFISYEVTEIDYRSLSATLGAVSAANGGKSRQLDVSVRVGSPKLDNYHRMRGPGGTAHMIALARSRADVGIQVIPITSLHESVSL